MKRPNFHFLVREEIRVVYNIPLDGIDGYVRLEIVGNPEWANYEWCIWRVDQVEA